MAHVIRLEVIRVGIFLLDGAESGRRGKKRLDLVFRDHPPERARIGRADRLALIDHRGRPGDQRAIDDIAVADHPADIGGGPEDVTGLDIVEVGDRPGQRDQMAAIVAHHPFGLAGRARGIEHI